MDRHWQKNWSWQKNFPQKITVNKVDLFDETKIAHVLNSFFTNVGGKTWQGKSQMLLHHLNTL